MNVLFRLGKKNDNLNSVKCANLLKTPTFCASLSYSPHFKISFLYFILFKKFGLKWWTEFFCQCSFIGFVCIGHWVSMITLPVAKFYLNWSLMFQWQPYSGVGEKGRKITRMVRIFWSIVNFRSLAHQHLAYFSPYCTIFPAKQFEKRLHEVFEFWKQWKYEALTLLYHIKLHKRWRNP